MTIFNSKTYIAQFSFNNLQENNPLKRKACIQLNQNLQLSQEKISHATKAILQDISQHLDEDSKFLDTEDGWSQTITIRNYDEASGDVEYFSDANPEDVKNLSQDSSLHPLSDLVELHEIREFSLYPIKKKAEPISFCDHFFQILQDNPWLFFPILGWLVAFIWAKIVPAIQQDMRPLSPDEIAEGQLTTGPQAFCRFMNVISLDAESQKAFVRQENLLSLQILQHQAATCSQKGDAIIASLKNEYGALPVDELAQTFSEEIMTHAMQYQGQTGLDPVEIATIPLGYYRQGNYIPVLLSFSIREGQLIAQMINLDPSIGKKVVPIQHYSLMIETEEQIEQGKERLAQSLSVLLHLQQEPSPSAATKIGGALKALRIFEYFSMGGDHAPLERTQTSKEKENEDLRDVTLIIEELLNHAGLTKIEPPDPFKKLLSSSKEWSKSVWTWMESHYPSLSKDKKLSWETNILFNYIDSFLRSIQNDPSIPLEKRAQHLFTIEKMMLHVEKEYKKEYGGQKAFESIWQRDPTSREIFENIRNAIATLKSELLSRQFESLNTLRERNSEWLSFVKKQENPTSVRAETPIQRSLYLEARELLQNLENRIQHFSDSSVDLEEEANTIKALFDEYTAHCTELFRTNHYRDLVDAVAVILDKLPPPTHPLWDFVPEEQLDNWSEKITLLTQYVWEAHIKLNRRYLWPNQAIHLINGRAILSKLISRQSECAGRHLSEAFFSQSVEEQDQLIRHALTLVPNYCFDASRLAHFDFQTFKTYLREICENRRINNSHELNCVLIGKIASLVGLDLNETLNLALIGLGASRQQTQHIIHQHPYLRFGNDPEREAQVLAITQFYKSDPEKHKGILTLDVNDTYDHEENGVYNHILLNTVRGLLVAQVADIQYEVESSHAPWFDVDNRINSNSWKRPQSGQNVIPYLAIDLRRHTLFTQSLLHPESTLFKGFSGTIDAFTWTLNVINKAIRQDEEADTERTVRNGIAIEEMERFQTLAQMGHLDIVAEPGKVTHVTDERGSLLLEYNPTGPRMLELRDPFHDACIIGKQSTIPQAFISSKVSQSDFTGPERDWTGAEIHEREQKAVLPWTEVRMVAEEKNSPSSDLDALTNAKLRSLIVEGKDGMVSINTIYNVFEFIFDHPDLMEVEECQHVLELALKRTALLQRLFQTNPEYLLSSQISQRLKQSIEYAIQNDRKKAAGFLMHVGSLLKRHADFAVQQMQNEESVYRVLFKDVREAYHECSEDFQKRTLILIDTLKDIPSFTTLYAYRGGGVHP